MSAVSTSLENNSLENLSLYLLRLPQGRYDYYIESKNLYGYSQDLMLELNQVLKEFNETEKENAEIRQKFLKFIEDNQKILMKKEYEVNFLHDEIEKNGYFIKTLQTQNKEINQINEAKEEKIIKLNAKTEEFENTINELNNEIQGLNNEISFYRGIFKNSQNWKKINNFHCFFNQYIQENIQEIKSQNPGLFCKCLGNIDSLQAESLHFKKKSEELGRQLREMEENYEDTHAKMINCEHELRMVKKQNLKLSSDFKQIVESKGQFLAQMEHEILLKTRKLAENIRMGSLILINSNDYLESDNFNKIRTPANRNNRKKPNSLDTAFKKSEAESPQKDSLLNDLENSFGKSLDDKSFNEMMVFDKNLEENKRKIKNKLSLMSSSGIVIEDLGDGFEEKFKMINCSALEKNSMIVKKDSSIIKNDSAGFLEWQTFFIFWFVAMFYKILNHVFYKNNNNQGIKYGTIVAWRGNKLVMKIMISQIKKSMISVFYLHLITFKLILSFMLKIKKMCDIMMLMGRTFNLIKKKI